MAIKIIGSTNSSVTSINYLVYFFPLIAMWGVRRGKFGNVRVLSSNIKGKHNLKHYRFVLYIFSQEI